ncbi:serine hydrolase domain-containing protein [Aquimarina rhabdastrellae]
MIKYSLLSVFLFTISMFGQLDTKQVNTINNLFKEWNVPNHPGGTIAIMESGKLMYSKAYGLANLEYKIPNTTTTIFNTGSIAKQVTAMGIVLLQEQGKLSFDDPVQKYIPEFPDFKDTIRIHHLLYHTSGLRDVHGLLALAGWRREDAIANKDLNTILYKQKTLNFKPGSEFLYSNTGYMLLTTIIENITGTKFKLWIKDQVLDPLGMEQTYVEDQYANIVYNKATSYEGEEAFKTVIPYWGYVGSGNLYSTTGDLLKWLAGFNTSEKPWSTRFKTLLKATKLNDGTGSNYTLGMLKEEHLGRTMIQHGGAIGGFRAIVRAYPEEELSIVILTNFTKSDIVSKTNVISKLVLGETKTTVKKNKTSAKEIKENIKLTYNDLNKFEGIYWNPKEKYGRKIYIKNDTLIYGRNKNNESSLLPISNDSFKMMGVKEKVIVRFKLINEVYNMIVALPNEPLIEFVYHESITQTDKENVIDYTGRYYSDEVENSYTIAKENSGIYCYHIRHGKIKLKQLHKDILIGEWPVNTIEIIRSKKNKVKGLQITNGRVRNLYFKKL